MPSVRVALCLAMLLSAPALAADPVDHGTFGKWKVFSATSPDGKVCYALTNPTAALPKKARAKLDDIYVIVSTWPGRSVRDEVEIVPGYLYREGEPVIAQVGNVRAEFFARNDAKAGTAWVKSIDDETALVSAMRGGATMTVNGVSKKGTKTTDTYSLSGMGSALDRAHRECGK